MYLRPIIILTWMGPYTHPPPSLVPSNNTIPLPRRHTSTPTVTPSHTTPPLRGAVLEECAYVHTTRPLAHSPTATLAHCHIITQSA